MGKIDEKYKRMSASAPKSTEDGKGGCMDGKGGDPKLAKRARLAQTLAKMRK